MDNYLKFQNLRNKYNEFIFDSYKIEENSNNYEIIFKFIITNLCEFNPKITISKNYLNNDNINLEFLNYLVFNLGMVELVSYYKCVCSKKIIVKCGYLDNDQIEWFKKLYYNGLGEFLYTNNITIDYEDFVEIECTHDYNKIPSIDYIGKGNLIPVGGGKDSCVTMELLNKEDNTCFVINSKDVMEECIKLSNISNIVRVNRLIDKKLIDLNKEGYLNGHTPFSALVSFLSYICAYLAGKKYIVLSNEASANEPTVPGTNINHQYSKTYEYENDFNNYTKEYFKIDIKYFSLLRPLKEIEIAKLFAKYNKYHGVFKSCNRGSKKTPWEWCNNCPKCLFVYIILYPFLTKDEMINIFKEDLYEKEELLETFKELIGVKPVKPFECIGEINEVRYAVSLAIKKNNVNKLPILLKYYYDLLPLSNNEELLSYYNNENNLDDNFKNIIKEALK